MAESMIHIKPPACKDCRHFVNDHSIPMTTKFGRCRLAVVHEPARIDPVDGALVPATDRLGYASIERSNRGGGEGGACGELAARFDPQTDLAALAWNQHGGTLKTSAQFAAIMVIYSTAVAVANNLL